MVLIKCSVVSKMMDNSPIVLFVNNRLEHTKKTVAALQSNLLANISDLFIYSDFAKSEREALGVADVRKYIAGFDGFNSIKYEDFF